MPWDTIITAILEFFKVNKDSRRTKSKRKLRNIMITIFIIVISLNFIYFCFDSYNKLIKTEKIPDCSELVVKVDSLSLKIKKLEYDNDILKTKYANINIDKYPFELTPKIVENFRYELKNIFEYLNCSKIALDLFHNPIGLGYTPININGTRSYINISVLISMTNAYTRTMDEFYYQNYPLKFYAKWIDIYGSTGIIEFHKSTASVLDKRLMEFTVVDYNKFESAYVFAITNPGDINKYGPFIGCLVMDFGENDRYLTDKEKLRVTLYCDELGVFLNKYRKKDISENQKDF